MCYLEGCSWRWTIHVSVSKSCQNPLKPETHLYEENVNQARLCPNDLSRELTTKIDHAKLTTEIHHKHQLQNSLATKTRHQVGTEP